MQLRQSLAAPTCTRLSGHASCASVVWNLLDYQITCYRICSQQGHLELRLYLPRYIYEVPSGFLRLQLCRGCQLICVNTFASQVGQLFQLSTVQVPVECHLPLRSWTSWEPSLRLPLWMICHSEWWLYPEYDRNMVSACWVRYYCPLAIQLWTCQGYI